MYEEPTAPAMGQSEFLLCWNLEYLFAFSKLLMRNLGCGTNPSFWEEIVLNSKVGPSLNFVNHCSC